MTSVEVNITARDKQVEEPWIWRLSRDFELKVTILKASVDAGFGTMTIRLDGAVEEVQRAISWLMTTGMHVDAKQRAVGAIP